MVDGNEDRGLPLGGQGVVFALLAAHHARGHGQIAVPGQAVQQWIERIVVPDQILQPVRCGAGENDAGEPLSDGVYAYELEAKDIGGNRGVTARRSVRALACCTPSAAAWVGRSATSSNPAASS